MFSKSPKLWIVATPIGNLGDVSFRVKEVLSKVDVILAEDTRKAGIFCSLIGIEKKKFLSLFDQNEDKRIHDVVRLLKEGKEIAIISNAGTPIISDPGYKVVKTCREMGFEISVVPGPCAPIAALVLSGFPPIPFTFLGFLPRSKGDKKKLFLKFKDTQSTLIFFERKSRLVDSIKYLFETLGEREVCIARELTKKHEEVIFINSVNELEKISHLKGELTIVVSPLKNKNKDKKPSINEVKEIILENIKKRKTTKEIIKELMEITSGWTQKELYKIVLELKDKEI